MSEWRVITLDEAPIEILDGDRGKNYPKKHEFSDNGYCLFLNTKNVTSSGFNFTELNFITKEKDCLLRKGKLERNDVILTTRGTVGNVAFYNERVDFDNIRINSGMVIIRPIDLHPIFNYQLFKFLALDLSEFISGSAQPQLPIKDLKQVAFKLPPLPEQKAIAEVLSSLDDKIDLLHRQNKTLEQMAETLFRQWFVEEAGEDWEEGVIADLADHLKNSIKPQQNEDTLFNHYSIPSYDNGKEPVQEIGKEIKSNKYIVPINCILFSKLNPHKDKRVWLLTENLPENSICSTEFQVVHPKNKSSLYFLYGWLSLNENFREIASGIGGTSGSHQRISPLEIFNFNCPVIPDEKLNEYNLEVEPIYQKQFNNQTQIRTLEKLRDTLLPKLMSGEVRITSNG